MESHRNVIIALSLSVVALSAVTVFQSLNQAAVLGTNTSSAFSSFFGPQLSPTPVVTSADVPPTTSSIPCASLSDTFNAYCSDSTLIPDDTGAVSSICTDLGNLLTTNC